MKPSTVLRSLWLILILTIVATVIERVQIKRLQEQIDFDNRIIGEFAMGRSEGSPVLDISCSDQKKTIKLDGKAFFADANRLSILCESKEQP